MDNTRKELWDQLDGESERAFGAFRAYMSLPSRDRTVLRAYRQHVGNPGAVKASDTWSRWSRLFAWSERARARDAHLDRIRERSIEKAIEAEAERQAREVEKTRYRYNELLTRSYEEAIECLESGDFLSQMRPQDVINIIKLHFEVVEKQGGFNPPEQDTDLTEEELAELDRILDDIEGEDAQEEPEEGSVDDLEEDHPQEGSEGTE